MPTGAPTRATLQPRRCRGKVERVGMGRAGAAGVPPNAPAPRFPVNQSLIFCHCCPEINLFLITFFFLVEGSTELHVGYTNG